MNREQIEAVLPHRGAMCLIDEVVECDGQRIRCLTARHRDPGNPLRDAGGLGMANAVEIAAQAMALHAACSPAAVRGAADRTAGATGTRSLARQEVAQHGATPARLPQGRLASIRSLELAGGRLDEAGTPLAIEATLVSGDAGQAMYEFRVLDGTRALASGRATVVLQASR